MEQTNVVQSQPIAKKKSEVWGWIRFFIYLAIAYLLIMNTIGLTKVSGNSMLPTLHNKNIVLVNKLSAHFGSPKYGDVVVIHSPKLAYDIVKRVIAVEGDVVAIFGGVVYVNGIELTELYSYGTSDDMAEIQVGSGELFVLGDNRTPGESLDSRSTELGLVHKDELKGYLLLKIVPWGGIAKPLDL